jgi:hypothetical protein
MAASEHRKIGSGNRLQIPAPRSQLAPAQLHADIAWFEPRKTLLGWAALTKNLGRGRHAPGRRLGKSSLLQDPPSHRPRLRLLTPHLRDCRFLQLVSGSAGRWLRFWRVALTAPAAKLQADTPLAGEERGGLMTQPTRLGGMAAVPDHTRRVCASLGILCLCPECTLHLAVTRVGREHLRRSQSGPFRAP